jgi:hypothetical protein
MNLTGALRVMKRLALMTLVMLVGCVVVSVGRAQWGWPRPATALQAYVLVTVAVIAVCARCCETAAAAPMALVCYSKLPGTSGMQLFQIPKKTACACLLRSPKSRPRPQLTSVS